MKAPQNKKFYFEVQSSSHLAHLYTWNEYNICRNGVNNGRAMGRGTYHSVVVLLFSEWGVAIVSFFSFLFFSFLRRSHLIGPSPIFLEHGVTPPT